MIPEADLHAAFLNGSPNNAITDSGVLVRQQIAEINDLAGFGNSME
jgi:hypothetical protein